MDERDDLGNSAKNSVHRDKTGVMGTEAKTPGILSIVATPIGNLEDISKRALSVLAQADIVAAEDTRRTGRLLQAYGLKKTLMSCYAHNEEKQSQRIVELLSEGMSVALVSDAGMPGIADPGARLVRQVIDAGIKLTVIPGPSAGIAALAASGLDTGMYAFSGFFPRTNKEKKAWLAHFGSFPGTIVLYESPKRTSATLGYLYEALGDRHCCIARELTKLHEEFIRGSLLEVSKRLEEAQPLKGEVVVVLEGSRGAGAPSKPPEEAEALGRALLAGGMGKKEASRELARVTGISAKECYTMLLNIKRT